MGGDITLTAQGPQGIGKTLLLNAIAEFLSTDEATAPESLKTFRKVYGLGNVVYFAEVQD